VGQKLAITSPKPQSTRTRVTGILTREHDQIVLLDTPGLLDPRYELHEAMRRTARQAIRDADVILYLIDATAPTRTGLMDAAGLGAPPAAPVVTVFNKVDLVSPAEAAGLREAVQGSCLVSATSGQGVDDLLDHLARLLPEGPFLYDSEDVSTQNLRFFAAELVRETALEQLDEEVPYAVACAIEEFREDRSPVYIRAVVYVERESQKRIVIGHRGAGIKALGQAARAKIEAMLETTVYLDLWVKVLPNWRRDANAVRRLGYEMQEDPGS
jgi:GTP-binding protein Era